MHMNHFQIRCCINYFFINFINTTDQSIIWKYHICNFFRGQIFFCCSFYENTILLKLLNELFIILCKGFRCNQNAKHTTTSLVHFHVMNGIL